MYRITRKQRLPIDIDLAWDFFSDPRNLNIITPESMNFVTLSGDERKMFPGQIIHYKISPFSGISMEWVTEISHVRDNDFFVDEQRFGPYQLWHHQHHFKMIESGVEMTDIVHYRNPLGFLGNIANSLFVKKQLQKIFEYRFKAVEKRFGKWPDNTANKVEFFKAA